MFGHLAHRGILVLAGYGENTQFLLLATDALDQRRYGNNRTTTTYTVKPFSNILGTASRAALRVSVGRG